MNEEAIQYSYELFKNDGYDGTIDDYKSLINSDNEALNYSYSLFSKDGYDGSADDFKGLMGIGQTPEAPKGDAAEVSGESASTSADTISSSDSEKSNEKPLNPFAATMFPELYKEYRELEKKVSESPIMLMEKEINRLQEIEEIFNTQPVKKSYKRIVDEEIAELDKQQDELVAKYNGIAQRTGRDLEQMLQSDGVYEGIIKRKKMLNESKALDEGILTEISKDTNSDQHDFLGKIGRVFGINAGASQEADQVLDLNPEIEEQILLNLDGNQRLKEKIAKGYATLNEKENLINNAKVQVVKRTANRIKGQVQDIISSSEDPAIKQEKLEALDEEYNTLLGQVGIDQTTGILKNNFKKTDESQEFDELISSDGYLASTGDATTSFLEGVVQTGFKGTVGFTSDVMSGFGDTFTDQEGYSVFDAFGDTVNQLANYNYLPSSRKVDTQIVDTEGDLNVNYKTVTKTLAQVLPFTLAIVNDVKKGKVSNIEASMGRLLNPTKSQSVRNQLNMIDSAYRHTLSDNLNMAEELGLNDNDGRIFANTLSLAEGMAEMIMPDTKFFKTTAGDALLQTFKGDLKSAATSQAKKQVVTNFVKNMALELGEEEVVLATEDLLKFSMVVGHENSEFFDMKRQKELAMSTVILSGALGGANVKRDYQGNVVETYKEISKNINDVTESLQQELSSGVHSPEVEAEITKSIDWANHMNKAITTAPENVTGEQVDLLMQKQSIIEEMKNVDDAFHPQYKAKIEAINQKINPTNETGEKKTTGDTTVGTTENVESGKENAEAKSIPTESKEKVEVAEEVEQEEETPKDVKASYKKAAEAVRSAKFYKTPAESMSKLQSDPTGLLKFAWDGAMETMALSIEATGNIDAAVRKGVAQIKQSEWYKNLSPEGKKQALEISEKEFRANLQPMADAHVKIPKKPVKQQIRKATGQTDTSKKVVTTEAKALKEKFKNLEKGSKLGAKAIMQAKKELIGDINKRIRPLIKNGTLRPADHSRVLSAINQYDGKNMDKVEPVINKIIESIDNHRLKNSVKKNRKAVKTKVRTTYGKTGDPIRRLLKYKPEWLNPQELSELNDVLEMFNTSTPSNVDMSKVVELEEKLKNSYLEKIGERIDRSKEESDNYDEKAELANLMAAAKTSSKSKDLTPEEQEIVDGFLRIEPEYFDALSKAEINKLNKTLTALVNDGIMLNKTLFDHVANNDAAVAANELSGKLGDNLLKTQKSLLESVTSLFKNKSKGETSEDIFRKVERKMLHHIDGVIKNFKGNGLYNNIIHPITSKMEKSNKASGEVSRELTAKLRDAKNSRQGSRSSRLLSEVKKSAKISDQMAENYEYRLQVLLQLYMREKEFRANPEYKNSKVFSVKEHIDSMNKNPENTTLVDPENDLKVVNELYDKFKDDSGNIDIDKVEAYFTKEEKALVDFMEGVIADMESKNRFVNDHVRGESLTFLNNYFPRKSGKAVSEDSTADVVAMSRMLGALGVKAGSSNERVVNKAEALDFDTLGSFMQYVNSSNIEYHISPELKKMRKLASMLANKKGENAKLGKVLLKSVESLVRAKVTNVNDPMSSRKEKFFNIIKRKTFNKILIDPIKLVGWDIPSSWGVIGLSNIYRAGRIKKANANVDTKLRKQVMDDFGSVHAERFGSRSVDIKETSSSTISKSKYKTSNPKRRDNMMDLVNKNLVSDLADKASDVYYQIVDLPMGMLWNTELFESFKKLTGKELNSENYQDLKAQYPKQMEQAIAKADKETSNVFNTASVSEQKLSLQNKSSSSLMKFADSFMKSFAFNENSTMWDSMRSFVGKGNMTKEEAIRNFAIINARGILYAYASQMIMGAVLPMMFGLDMDDEEVDKLNEQAAKRSLAQHGMLMFMGNYGNLVNMAAAFLVESMRELYIESDGESKYNPYEDSVLYSIPERGKLSSYTGALGAEGEVIKVAYDGIILSKKLAEKAINGEEITQEDLIEWKAAGYSLNLLSQLTGLSTYRLGKIVDKQLKASVND